MGHDRLGKGDVEGDPDSLRRLGIHAVLELRARRIDRDLHARQVRERAGERGHLHPQALEGLPAQAVDHYPEGRRDQPTLVVDDVLRLILPEGVLLRVELDFRDRERVVRVGTGQDRRLPGRKDVAQDACETGERIRRIAGHHVVAAGKVARVVGDHLVDAEAQLYRQVVDEAERAAEAHRVAVTVHLHAADLGAGEGLVHPI